ncbi:MULTISPECIES: SDR family oxidoreductase [Streptomyces]|uniref:SDR family oxidoreductase n=1 Tax=Streptomyces TaxID=1883 RepID=UPI00167BBF96|nr:MULTISPECIES: SDR family oxidoreductase [Streptomyces]MBK3527816.1 SDR family oxidoreductase [Streptomyces sp. MBT70]GGR95447.1 NAD-dependent epimerase [Streptomyces eurythermus]
MDRPITVIGGTGSVGTLIVRKLLDRGERVRVVGRSGLRAQNLPEGAVFFPGDVRDCGTLTTPLADVSAVVFSVEPGTANTGPDSPKTTMYQGVCNALAAAGADGNRPHFTLISQIFVTRHDHPINAWGGMLDWRLAGEDAVRESGLPYTVIRPGWLTQVRPGQERVRLEQGDRGEGSVSREDVAEAAVRSLALPSADGLTFEIFNEPGARRTDWNDLFASLDRDQVPVG